MAWFHIGMKSAAALVAICAGSQAVAGEIGPTSRATVAISVSIAPRIEVVGIRDVGASDQKSLVSDQPLCIASTIATGAYGIALLAPDSAGAAANSAAPFTLEWAQEAGPSSPIPAGTTVMGFVAPSGRCSDQNAANARLVIRSSAQSGIRNSATAATLLIVPE